MIVLCNNNLAVMQFELIFGVTGAGMSSSSSWWSNACGWLRVWLLQVHASREECYDKLQKHRHSLRTDRHYLEEHQKQHERLIKIGQRTDVMAASVEEV